MALKWQRINAPLLHSIHTSICLLFLIYKKNQAATSFANSACERDAVARIMDQKGCYLCYYPFPIYHTQRQWPSSRDQKIFSDPINCIAVDQLESIKIFLFHPLPLYWHRSHFNYTIYGLYINLNFRPICWLATCCKLRIGSLTPQRRGAECYICACRAYTK